MEENRIEIYKNMILKTCYILCGLINIIFALLISTQVIKIKDNNSNIITAIGFLNSFFLFMSSKSSSIAKIIHKVQEIKKIQDDDFDSKITKINEVVNNISETLSLNSKTQTLINVEGNMPINSTRSLIDHNYTLPYGYNDTDIMTLIKIQYNKKTNEIFYDANQTPRF
jgi:hypothetical protein